MGETKRERQDDGTPGGFVRLKGYGDAALGLRAYQRGAELVICGIPPETEPEDDDRAHNCDQMACGMDHVLARFTLPPPPAERGRTGSNDG